MFASFKAMHLSLIFTVLLASPMQAFPPTGRIVEGVLREVHPGLRSAVVATPHGIAPITWTPRTRIFQNGAEACPCVLGEGTRVRVTRHVPIFGPPFVRQMNLLEPTSK